MRPVDKYSDMNSSLVHQLVLFRKWLPVFGLTTAAFVFNTSEFVPIGLLSDIARDFHMTEANAGLLITVYAWVVAMASLPLMLLVSRVEYRKLLLGVVGLFVVSHLVSSVASSYSMLMASRIGVACSHAVFWSIASPLAVCVAPKEQRSTALGLIVAGTSVAMIVGLPLGRIIGLHAGWRMTFFYIAVVAAAVWILLAWSFPKVKSDNTISLHKVPALLNKPVLMGIYLLTLVLITAHYTGYSYIEPFLGQVAHLSDGWVTGVLTLFGLVGIAGSVLFSRYYDRNPSVFIRCSVIGIAVALLLLYPASFTFGTMIALCVGWGLAITIFNLVFQSEIIQQAPHSTAVAMSVYSGIYNVGIGGGSLAGGIVCSDISMDAIGYVGGAIAVAAVIYCFWKLLPLLNGTEAK